MDLEAPFSFHSEPLPREPYRTQEPTSITPSLNEVRDGVLDPRSRHGSDAQESRVSCLCLQRYCAASVPAYNLGAATELNRLREGSQTASGTAPPNGARRAAKHLLGTMPD